MVGARRRFLVVGLVIALMVAFAGQALAAKGGHGKARGGSLELVMMDPTDGAPHWGETATFEVSTTATDRPYVVLDCYQGSLVYSASAGFYSGYPWPSDRYMTLSSNTWTGGAADCTATLFYFDGRHVRDLATMSFHAYA